jgi:EamA domain-containing membrane protein RarD
VVVQGGLLLDAEAARVVALQIIIQEHQAVRRINQTNHREAKDLVIEVGGVNIVPLALTYGAAAEVVQVLKGLTQDHILAHHKALQVELEEQIA